MLTEITKDIVLMQDLNNMVYLWQKRELIESINQKKFLYCLHSLNNFRLIRWSKEYEERYLWINYFL